MKASQRISMSKALAASFSNVSMPRNAGERSDQEKDEIYSDWKRLINMSKDALDKWAENPDRLKASLNRSEADSQGDIQSGYDSLHRIKRRVSKPREDWSSEDYDNAAQENGFNSRMLGNEPGAPVPDTGMSKWEISLRNWGHDPSLESSPAYGKWKQWKAKHKGKTASSFKVDMSHYAKWVKGEFEQAVLDREATLERARAVDIRDLQRRVKELVPEAKDIRDLGKTFPRDVMTRLNDIPINDGRWDEAHKIIRTIWDLMGESQQAPDYAKEARILIAKTERNMKALASAVSKAIGRVPVWNGSNIRIEVLYDKDWVNPIEDAIVHVGNRGASFTLFGGGKLYVEDVLDSGDREFFRTPEEESDYFSLVKELQKPGSSAKGDKIVLYTARPTKDRDFYARSRSLPSGIFLTTDIDRAYGIAHDLGGREVRDIWKVVTDDAYLIQTLNAGRTKDYQVVREAPARMTLIVEGSPQSRNAGTGIRRHLSEMPYQELPSPAKKALREFGIDFHNMTYLYGAIPTKALIREVMTKNADVRGDFKDWEEYHSWYMNDPESGRGTPSGAVRWPIVLTDEPGEVIDDGWHRFHQAVAAGESNIYAVLPVSKGRTALAAKVAHEYRCLEVARQLTAGKTAGTRADFEHPEVLAAFGSFLPVRTASLTKKLSQVLALFKKAPKVWEEFKSMMRVKSIADLPRAIKDLAKQGFSTLGKLVKKATETFPLSIYFVPKHRVAGLTELMSRLMSRFPKLKALLDKVPEKLDPIDKWLNKYMPRLKRPLMAAIFIWVWMNVAEITWDFNDLITGFTGGLSLPQLFATFPESAIGFVFASFGVGYHFLPITLAARLLWLTAKGIIDWKKGGFEVDWARLGAPEQGRELVPAT